MQAYGLPLTVIVKPLPNLRPAVSPPAQRLKMHYAAVHAFILKVEKPVFTVLQFNPRPLMRAIYR